MIEKLGVTLETTILRAEIENLIIEYGTPIDVHIRNESNVDRDRYGSIKKFKDVDSYIIYAYPITSNPTTGQMEKGGLREKCDTMIWTPAKSWDDIGLNFRDFDYERMSFTFDGQFYIMSEKNQVFRVGNVFIHIVFGLTKK